MVPAVRRGLGCPRRAGSRRATPGRRKRSALSAASRVTGGPARALEVLGLYAGSVDGAENTTVASAFIDWDARTITYSRAGHRPPALLQPGARGPGRSRATS
jgi:hypothetical protein